MDDEYRNYYKLCRESASLTQQQAAELLDTSVESLSRYENGHTDVNGEMVLKMMEIYNAPSLGFWHLRNIDPVGRVCLAKSAHAPQTNGDLAFQSLVSSSIMKSSSKVIMRVMSDGQIRDDELVEFLEWIEIQECIISQLLNNVAYAKTLIRDRPKSSKNSIKAIKKVKKIAKKEYNRSE